MDPDKFLPDSSDHHTLELLLPHLQSYGIVAKNATIVSIKENDLKELATRWKIKINDSKFKKSSRKDQLLKLLQAYLDQNQARREGRRAALTSSMPALKEDMDKDLQKKMIKPLEVNYFGLPPWALQRTTAGIIYQGRKPYAEKKHFLSGDEEGRVEEGKEDTVKHGEVGQTESKRFDNVAAQRKVAHALLTMARNQHMVTHFLQRGGLESVFKLAFESEESSFYLP